MIWASPSILKAQPSVLFLKFAEEVDWVSPRYGVKATDKGHPRERDTVLPQRSGTIHEITRTNTKSQELLEQFELVRVIRVISWIV